MGPRPWKPTVELQGALDRGELAWSITLAGEISADRGAPLDLDTAIRFLPLVASERPDTYDAWACRWLARWLTESRSVTIDRAAEIAAALAELPTEPTALEAVTQAARG